MQRGTPPIVELAVGAQFATERPTDSIKLILFWHEFLRTEYPHASQVPAADDTFERFGEAGRFQRPELQLRLESIPSTRYQFANPTTDRMVQLQATQLYMNWLRRQTNYPRFSVIHQDFRTLFDSWQKFADANDIGEVIPNQWELCYVDFIPQGELWTTPKDWHRVSRLFTADVDQFEPLQLEDRNLQWRLRMPGDIGRLVLTVTQGRNEASQVGMYLVMRARGPAANPNELHDRLQTAHDEILQAFGRLATDDAKQYWGI